MPSLKRLTDRFARDNVRTVAIVDHQWGDAGKGKIIDWLSAWADVTARGTGGANAGHTIVQNGESFVFHLIPSGILWDDEGKLNVIGKGVAVEPRALASEIHTLERAGKTWDGLRISCNARLVLPIDIALDQLKEAGKGAGTIGTTGRGIGPVYESHVSRIGLVVNDLLNPDVFTAKLKRNLEARIGLFHQFDPALVVEILNKPELGNGLFYDGFKKIFNIEAIVDEYCCLTEGWREKIVDTEELVRKAVGKKNVLLEGAQGVLLSVDYGAHPYVTSSDCSLEGLVKGVGLRTEHVDYTLAVTKAPFMTRVGKGPFPTELGGKESAEWCNGPEASMATEEREYSEASINDSEHPFLQGVAIRRVGNEYGATTGRPRRVGWLDLPLLRYASQYGSKHVALTKVDVMSECAVIRLCVQYRYEGSTYWVGDKCLTHGTLLDVAIMDTHVLEHCVPIFKEFPGWCCDLSALQSKEEIPSELRAIIFAIVTEGGVSVDVLSFGADREQTIVL